MHNLKEIRKDFAVFVKLLEKRFINLDIKNLQKFLLNLQKINFQNLPLMMLL